MNTKKYSNSKIDKEQEAFFLAATRAFSNHGFRRTTMNDIAEAVGISRPTLYLTFKNKEDVFSRTISFLVNQALKGSIHTLSQSGPIEERFSAAMLDFEKVYYEPIAKSSYALEIINSATKLDSAAEAIKNGRNKLRGALSKALREAVRSGEVTFVDLKIQPPVFVSMLMTVLASLKYRDTANPDYLNMSLKALKRRNAQIIKIFLGSITTRP